MDVYTHSILRNHPRRILRAETFFSCVKIEIVLLFLDCNVRLGTALVLSNMLDSTYIKYLCDTIRVYVVFHIKLTKSIDMNINSFWLKYTWVFSNNKLIIHRMWMSYCRLMCLIDCCLFALTIRTHTKYTLLDTVANSSLIWPVIV